MVKHKNAKPRCTICGDEQVISQTGLCRKHRIYDLKLLSVHIEQGKKLIREALSDEKRSVWDTLTSQRKKLAVFQCWEYGWLYWVIPSGKDKEVGDFMSRNRFLKIPD